jgi:hypothetical protein
MSRTLIELLEDYDMEYQEIYKHLVELNLEKIILTSLNQDLESINKKIIMTEEEINNIINNIQQAISMIGLFTEKKIHEINSVLITQTNMSKRIINGKISETEEKTKNIIIHGEQAVLEYNNKYYQGYIYQPSPKEVPILLITKEYDAQYKLKNRLIEIKFGIYLL